MCLSSERADAAGNQVPTSLAEIQVAHGKYSVAGQTLPQDICIEIDSEDEQFSTKLDCIFSRNALLPAKKSGRDRIPNIDSWLD